MAMARAYYDGVMAGLRVYLCKSLTDQQKQNKSQPFFPPVWEISTMLSYYKVPQNEKKLLDFPSA